MNSFFPNQNQQPSYNQPLNKVTLVNGNNEAHNNYQGDLAEITWNTDTNRIHGYDGKKKKGYEFARLDEVIMVKNNATSQKITFEKLIRFKEGFALGDFYFHFNIDLQSIDIYFKKEKIMSIDKRGTLDCKSVNEG